MQENENENVAPENEPAQTETNLETRREMLLKIGSSLAALSVGALVGGSTEISAQRIDKNIVRVPTDIKTVLPEEVKEMNVFVTIAKKRGGSVIVVDSTETATVAKLKKQLGVNPARATVNGGLIQLDLGLAAEGRCGGNGKGAAGGVAFDPSGPIELKMRSIQRV